MTSERAPLEDLADYVLRVRGEKGLSQREVSIKSGKKISKGYIGQIENREVLGHSVTPQKLKALAAGLDVDEDEIFAVARGKRLTEDEQRSAEIERLIKYFGEVPRECQLDMLVLVESLWVRRRVEGRAERIAKSRQQREREGRRSDDEEDGLRKAS